VTQPEACQQLVEKAIATFGQIDSLINNAGISMVTRFDEITDLSIFEQVMQVNYLGAVYCTHYALPYLKASRGLLVAISSLCGKTAVPTRSGYVASKHAMQGFFDTLRIELRGTGVDVLVVSPGFVATDIRERALGANGQPLGQSPRHKLKQCWNSLTSKVKLPLKRKQLPSLFLTKYLVPCDAAKLALSSFLRRNPT
jgi:NAD(P)-dependent dehydrogenase (short-subunit alcohol dehydrogenase family)